MCSGWNAMRMGMTIVLYSIATRMATLQARTIELFGSSSVILFPLRSASSRALTDEFVTPLLLRLLALRLKTRGNVPIECIDIFRSDEGRLAARATSTGVDVSTQETLRLASPLSMCNRTAIDLFRGLTVDKKHAQGKKVQAVCAVRQWGIEAQAERAALNGRPAVLQPASLSG